MVLQRKPRQRDHRYSDAAWKGWGVPATKRECLVRKWVKSKKDFPWTWSEVFSVDDLWHICGGSQNDFTVN